MGLPQKKNERWFEIKEKGQEKKTFKLRLVKEIRDPKPTEIGACWCPGIGKEVVSVAQYPIGGCD